MTGVAGAPFYLNLYGQGSSAVLATGVGNFWDAVRAYLNPSMTLQVESSLVVLNEATGAFQEEVTWAGRTLVGAGTGEPLPSSTQLLLRHATGGRTGNRRVQGRSFVPGLMEGANTSGGGPISTVLDVFNTAAVTHLHSAAVRTGNPLVVWARPVQAHTTYDPKTGVAINHAQRDGVAHLVTGTTASSRWSVLRDRRF